MFAEHSLALVSLQMWTGWGVFSSFWSLAWRILLVCQHHPPSFCRQPANQSLGNPDTTEIGDLKGLNSNARVMIKLALYSAWARLQIASDEQKYLVAIVQPYTAMLTPLWLSSLQEFARLRFEPEISSTLGSGGLSDDLDDVYAALNRETLLKVGTYTSLDVIKIADIYLLAVLSGHMALSRRCHR